MNWTEIALGDALSIKHGFAFKSAYFEDDGSHLVLTPGNFHERGGFRSRPGKDRAYAGDFPEGYVLEEGDLIVAMTEQGPGLLGSSALVPEGNRYLHNQRIGLVSSLEETILRKQYLYHLFNTRNVRGQISGSASGTKVRHTSPERIYRVRVKIPEPECQSRIASILLAYNDLIENNRRRIALLEQSARELYREWFMRLRFPGYEQTRVVDGVPEGWGETSFAELAEFVNGYAFKPAHLGESGLPIVKIPELRNGLSAKTPRNPGNLIPSKYHIHDGDLLFSWSALLEQSARELYREWFMRTLAVNVWTSGDALLNQHLFLVVPKGQVSRAYLMFALREAQVLFGNQTVGATMKHIRRSALDAVPVLLPDLPLLREFENTLSCIWDQLINLHKQNRQLETARDLLLPRVMSGEVEV